jgi:hypothetical protein
MGKHIAVWSRFWSAAVLVFAAMSFASSAHADEVQRQILRGFKIAPVPLDLHGKDAALVGLGSYIVNTTGCNDCHTHPNWADGHNPFLGQRERINTAEYLAGGREFLTSAGALIATSANITPDLAGKPAGLTLAGFFEVMRTGHNPADPAGVLLQVMSWPIYRWKLDKDLIAIYQYLSAIPSLPDNPNPGP